MMNTDKHRRTSSTASSVLIGVHHDLKSLVVAACVSAITAVSAFAEPAHTPTAGRNEPPTVTEQSRTSAPLIGLRVRLTRLDSDLALQSLTPIYLGNAVGKTLGKATESVELDLIAKPGYAIGGLNTRSKGSDRLVAIQAVYMKLAGNRLDPKDSYKSSWLGGRGDGRETLLTADGKPLIGLAAHIAGKPSERNTITSLSLLIAEEPTTVAVPAPTPSPAPAGEGRGEGTSKNPAPPPAQVPAPTVPKPDATTPIPGVASGPPRVAPPPPPPAADTNKLFEALRAPEEMREKPPALESTAGWPDLLTNLDLNQLAIRGVWRSDGDVLITEAPAAGQSVLLIPAPVDGAYQLVARLDLRADGDRSPIFTLLLPVADKHIGVIFDSTRGAGLGPIGHQDPERNGTLVRGNIHDPARTHELFVRVVPSPATGQVAVDLALDGRYLQRWTGRLADLDRALSPGRLRLIAEDTGLALHYLRFTTIR
jgi:hypothetical protein